MAEGYPQELVERWQEALGRIGERDQDDIFDDFDRVEWLLDAEKDLIAGHLPAVADAVGLQRAVQSVGFNYAMATTRRFQPVHAAVRKEIETALRKIDDLNTFLDGLSKRANILLELQDRRETAFGPTGDAVTNVHFHLLALRGLVERALADLPTELPVVTNRPRHDGERQAIESLSLIWVAQTGNKPAAGATGGKKVGPFRQFCRAVLWPVTFVLGRPPSQLDSNIQGAVHPTRKNQS